MDADKYKNKRKEMHKILEAISKGIMNVLSTDIHDQNIDFDRANINNELDLQMALNDAVSCILQKNDKNPFSWLAIEDECKTIMACYKKGHRYKPTIGELQKLYQIRRFQGLSDATCPDISSMKWLDTSELITYVTGSGNELEIFNYDLHNGKDIKFLKLYDSRFNDGYIMIHKSYVGNERNKCTYANVELSPFDCITDRNEIIHDFDGYRNTYKYSITFNSETSDVIKKLLKHEKAANKGITNKYDAYIPAAGELKFINDHYDIIHMALEGISESLCVEMPAFCWSSTRYDDRETWFIVEGKLYHTSNQQSKQRLFPLFREARFMKYTGIKN